MGGHLRERSLVPLALVPGVDEQGHRPLQGPNAPRKTPAPAAKPRQVMAQFRIIAFDAVRLALALRHGVLARIQKLGIRWEAVTEITMGGRGIIHHLLHGVPVPVPDHAEAQNAAGVPLDAGYKVGRLFLRLLFWETNVNNSSSSRVSTALSFWRSWGRGGAGRLAAAWLTQLMTVW